MKHSLAVLTLVAAVVILSLFRSQQTIRSVGQDRHVVFAHSALAIPASKNHDVTIPDAFNNSNATKGKRGNITDSSPLASSSSGQGSRAKTTALLPSKTPHNRGETIIGAMPYAVTNATVEDVKNRMQNTATDGPSSSPYAYAFAIWRLDPVKKEYKGYLSSILVATRLLRTHGSTADVVAIIKLDFDSTYDELPLEDTQLLEAMKIRIHYLPKQDNDHHLNIYGTMFHKFTIFNLTDYRYVMYLDSDLMPMNSLDYLMELADRGVLKNHLVVASNREPSNGGLIMVRPNATIYQDIQRIIQNRGVSLGKGREWDEVEGWGHVIEAPDLWETNTVKTQGTRWSFWAAGADQGFIYHYCKYVMQDCTQILARKVIHFGKSIENGTTIIEKVWPVTSLQTSPFAPYSKKPYSFSGNCGYLTAYSSSPNDWPGCVPPYADFVHFTGRSKPWKPENTPKWSRKRPPKAAGALWWHTLLELREVEGLNISSLGIPLPY